MGAIRKIIWYVKYQLWLHVKTYFRNIWVFRKELSNSHPWDYSGLLLLMRRQIIQMEECQRVYGNHLNAHKVAKDMRIVIKLLDRLLEDDYSVQTDGEYDWIEHSEHDYIEMVCTKPRESRYIFPKGSLNQLYKHEENRKKADIEMLMSYLKHYRAWWD